MIKIGRKRQENNYTYSNDYAFLHIKQKEGELKIKLDLEDVEKIKPYYWFENQNSIRTLVPTGTKKKNKKYDVVNLRWFLLDIDKSKKRTKVYHVNGDRSDYTKGNLLATDPVDRVTFNPHKEAWEVQIFIFGKEFKYYEKNLTSAERLAFVLDDVKLKLQYNIHVKRK